MSASRSRTLFIICLILVSAAEPSLAASPDNPHADPNLIHQERYGPIRPNDTLWSIAKLFVKQGESIHKVISELEQANPNSIKPGKLVLAGEYIQRQVRTEAQDKPIPQPKLLAELHTVEAQLIGEIPTALSRQPETFIPENSPLPAAEIQAAERPLIPLAYLLIVLISLVTACGWGIRRFQFRRQQQKIEQDQLDIVNALKRESIKNRLKPLTD